jgi:hypothetical protein
MHFYVDLFVNIYKPVGIQTAPDIVAEWYISVQATTFLLSTLSFVDISDITMHLLGL